MQPEWSVKNGQNSTFVLIEYVKVIEDSSFGTNSQGRYNPQLIMLMKAYPNPFSNQCTLVLSFSEPTEIKSELFDLKGRLAFQQVDNIDNIGEQLLTLSPLNIEVGTYILRIQTKDGISSNMINYRP